MKKALLIIFLSIVWLNASAQNTDEKIKVSLSARVDTSSTDVKAIINLYENYLNSSPDSIYNNPYWNNKEKELYKDFDFSRESIFQGGITPKQLCQYFPPFIMSVEPIGDKYQIRILFSSNSTNPKSVGSKVWCIQKLNIIKENEKWVLENLIVELSKNWESTKVGRIEYVYPVGHNFNLEEAKLSIPFCNNIINRFNPSYADSFRYYVISSIDDMGLLENFDYYFVGSTKGKAREGMILTAKGNEYYPHEFVHQLLPKNPNRGLVIEEGLATFLGTKQDTAEYANNYLSKLADDLKNNTDKINFKAVVSQEVKFNGYQTAYPAGAAICELVFNKAGDEGLLMLMQANTMDYQKIISAITTITKRSEAEIEKEWIGIILNYNK